ncbi:hypothetical protein V1525DRAFT_425775 [Lipomyces kononenkoae]|uniref:Uncharacterized protein n=1 Tax=Lipomyces kononenkoae TaxID=34357 RepID=A0ACC3T3M8_LIPKO
MAAYRSVGRDVHFYDISRPIEILGRLMLTPSITEKTFLFALGILIVSGDPYHVYHRGHDTLLTPTNNAQGRISITDEWYITRTLSQTVSGRDEAFQERVRERDGKCVIIGIVNPDRLVALNDWSSYHAAHIFPVSAEELFIRNNFCRWITNREADDTGIAINPDENYRIIRFRDDIFNVGRRLLDPVCRTPGNVSSVSDELLRWHFRAGEPVFETDFPPGSDMVGEICSGPDAIKRVEAELFSRLGGLSFA